MEEGSICKDKGTSSDLKRKENLSLYSEATNTWELGKVVGLMYKGCEEQLINKIEVLGKVDNVSKSGVKENNKGGLGCRAKVKEVGDFIRSRRVEFCLIQETKKTELEEQLCKPMWGIGWVYQESLVAVILNGYWGSERTECCIVREWTCGIDCNISFLPIRTPVCLAGDFNSIRRVSKRAGRKAESCRRDIEAFDSFVRDSGLIDLPLHGCFYAWYRPDDSCKSRLNRFLINNNWISKWHNLSQFGLQRSLSDHCPILLEIKVKD
ncbi:hypothetical protein ACS0TY_010331 [Phlomoides rotata]